MALVSSLGAIRHRRRGSEWRNCLPSSEIIWPRCVSIDASLEGDCDFQRADWTKLDSSADAPDFPSFSPSFLLVFAQEPENFRSFCRIVRFDALRFLLLSQGFKLWRLACGNCFCFRSVDALSSIFWFVVLLRSCRRRQWRFARAPVQQAITTRAAPARARTARALPRCNCSCLLGRGDLLAPATTMESARAGHSRRRRSRYAGQLDAAAAAADNGRQIARSFPLQLARAAAPFRPLRECRRSSRSSRAQVLGHLRCAAGAPSSRASSGGAPPIVGEWQLCATPPPPPTDIPWRQPRRTRCILVISSIAAHSSRGRRWRAQGVSPM